MKRKSASTQHVRGIDKVLQVGLPEDRIYMVSMYEELGHVPSQ